MKESVYIYMLHADQVRQTDSAWVEKNMPKRYEKAMRYRKDQDKNQSLGVGILLRDVVGIKSEDEIKVTQAGMLYADGYPYFSISHSGGYDVVVKDDTAIGVDIEKMDEANLSIADTVFTEEENIWVRANPLRRFHQVWTAKESVTKAIGLGLGIEPKSFSVVPLLSGEAIHVKGHDWYGATGYHDGCVISVCTAYPVGELFLTTKITDISSMTEHIQV